MAANLHMVVIAGGSGTRFWPLSRRLSPKQLLDLNGQGPMLAATLARVRTLAAPQRCWMVVGQHHVQASRRAAPQVPADQVLAEPVGRNTAPAIALAAVHVRKRDPRAVLVVLPADHYVAHEEAFCAALQRAAQLAQAGAIVTLGIRPTHPETGYGYIQRGAPDGRVDGAFFVERFCEKPTAGQAVEFLAQGHFDWNAGIFVMRPDVYLAEVERQLPRLFEQMAAVEAAVGQAGYQAQLNLAYRDMQAISIDYGVMEKARAVSVLPVDCGWSDVGSWSALGAVVPPDERGNVLQGRVIAIDSADSVAYATQGSAVALIGVEGLVVVHTPDATLVMPAQRAQDVRAVIAQLEEKGWNDLL